MLDRLLNLRLGDGSRRTAAAWLIGAILLTLGLCYLRFHRFYAEMSYTLAYEFHQCCHSEWFRRGALGDFRENAGFLVCLFGMCLLGLLVLVSAIRRIFR